jgi:hypothetical protein
LLEERGLVV